MILFEIYSKTEINVHFTFEKRLPKAMVSKNLLFTHNVQKKNS